MVKHSILFKSLPSSTILYVCILQYYSNIINYHHTQLNTCIYKFVLFSVFGYQNCWSWIDSHIEFSLRCPTGDYFIVVNDVTLVQSDQFNRARSRTYPSCPQEYKDLATENQCQDEKRNILDHVRHNCNSLPSCAVSAHTHHQLTQGCEDRNAADYTVVHYNCFPSKLLQDS